ncbi:MAG: DUF3301 domain-containing protein [Sulfuricella sp.]
MELFLIIFFLVLGWFWIDSMAAREQAELTGKRACRKEGVQFLDDTVAFSGLGFGRDGWGHLKLRRTYRFEFSDTGDNRLKGMVVMLGREVETLDLEKRFLEVKAPLVIPPQIPMWRWEGSHHPRHGHRNPTEEES